MEFTVADFLAMTDVADMRIVAGKRGIMREITRTNIMDNPDTFDWLMPGEFMLSTGYIFRDDEQQQRQIIRALSEIGCAGLCIKIKRYLPEIPACMIEEADRLDFPLIEHPFGYPLSTTINNINRKLFYKSDAKLERTIEIHQELTQTVLTSLRLPSIAETLVNLIGNPVIITDSDWNLLCLLDQEDNPFPLKEYISTQKKKRPFPLEFTDNLPQDLNYYKKAVTRAYTAENGKRVHCRIIPVAAHDYIYGYIIVWETVRDLGELDFIALEQAAVIVAIERVRSQEIEEIKLRVKKDFFDDLLAGNIESEYAIRSLSDLHGLSFDKNYRCLLICCGNDEEYFHEQSFVSRNKYRQSIERCTAAVMQAADEAGFKAICLPKGFQVVVILEVGTAPDGNAQRVRQMTQHLVAALETPPALEKLLVLVGQSVSSVAEIHKSFQNVHQGIKMAHTNSLNSTAIFMDDFAVYQLLSENVNQDTLRHFYTNSIGILEDYDQKNGTEMVETLNKYFCFNGNITDAAKAMYIHRNTYIYRIEKIKTLLNTDLKDPRKLLELQVGLLALNLLSG